MDEFLAISADFMEEDRWLCLEDRLGPPGVVGLIRLCFWAARYRPDGDLGIMGAMEVECAAQVRHLNGDPMHGFLPGQFLECLLDCGFAEELQAGDHKRLLLVDFGLMNLQVLA